jgi:hypothetical protein
MPDWTSSAIALVQKPKARTEKNVRISFTDPPFVARWKLTTDPCLPLLSHSMLDQPILRAARPPFPNAATRTSGPTVKRPVRKPPFPEICEVDRRSGVSPPSVSVTELEGERWKTRWAEYRVGFAHITDRLAER